MMLQKYVTADSGARDLVIIDFLKLFCLALIFCSWNKQSCIRASALIAESCFKGLFLPHLIGGLGALLEA